MKRLPATLLLTGLLLVAAIAAFAFVQLRAAGKRAAAQDQLLADVATEVAKSPPSSELSSLVTRIRAIDGHESDRRFVIALAQIERVRGRYQAAWDLLLPFATAGDANTAELREGALLSLELHAHSGDRQAGRRAMDLAGHAYASSRQAADLLVAWQAARRTYAVDDRDLIADRMKTEQPETKEWKLIAGLAKVETAKVADLVELAADFPVEPLEIGIARTVLLLLGGQPADAVNEADRLCQRAPGVADVRNFAAAASLALAQQEGTPEATRQALRAKAASHLEWLLKNAPEDGRRGEWTRLLGR